MGWLLDCLFPLYQKPVLSRKRSPKWSSEKGRVFFFTTRVDVET